MWEKRVITQKRNLRRASRKIRGVISTRERYIRQLGTRALGAFAVAATAARKDTMMNLAALCLTAIAMCSTSAAFVLAPTPVSIQRSSTPGVLSTSGTSRGDPDENMHRLCLPTRA